MKERAIRIGVLSAVFVLAIIVFGYLTNRGNIGLYADMGSATLPTISFEIQGKDSNLLVGHKREMNLIAMRDTIVVYGETGELAVNIHHNEGIVDTLQYEIYSLNGDEKLYEGATKKIDGTIHLDMGQVLKAGEEGILKIILSKEDDHYYYYTRIVKDNNFHMQECLQYVKELHENLLHKENEDAVKKVMESNSSGDNTTLQHVTIHSDLNHVMWGNLKPTVVDGINLEVKEVKKSYMSVLLTYQVKCAGDNNEQEFYRVKEFFKVAYGTDRMYLLAYDRTMEEVFNTSNVVLSGKGIILGIAEANLQYKVNEEGTIVAFVKGNELWSYNKKEDYFALVFSFASTDNRDERNRTDNHFIQILSMEDNGSMTFSVSGYMNRGEHEGESGIAVYYYHASQNSVEEEAFIPSTQSHFVIKEELNELAYYNKKQDMLYVMADGTLQKIDLEKGEKTIVVEGLQNEQYVTSDDGHLLAYQKNDGGQVITEVWDFAQDSRRDIPTQNGEVIVPLGFVGDDFVYGVFAPGNVGYDASGAEVRAMHRLEIRNNSLEIVKTYQQTDIYILDVSIDNNQITLKQGVKKGNVYQTIAEDYITNNEVSSNEYVELNSYWTDLKQTQYRLVFTKGIQDKKAKVLKPKQVLMEIPNVLELENANKQDYYYVYGHGEQMGIFADAGEAISLAEKLSGVVISPNQTYIWEAHNRAAWYRNFNVSAFTAKSGESTLAACVKKVLAYEGTSVDVTSEMNTKMPEQILSEQLGVEAIRFRGCSVKDMFYLIDKGVPVIALKNSSSAVLLVGYDTKTVTYIDPSNGATRSSSIDAMDEILAGSGGTFIGYVK